MLKSEAHQYSFMSTLYNKIPKNHILRAINSAISLSFINDYLKESYCSNWGRPAKEPEMMMRILILQKLYNLSDERVIECLHTDLAFMWFIGINPEDDIPHASLLSKFRTTRLKDSDLDDIICEITRQCIGKSKSIARILEVGENASVYYKYSQFAKTDEFKEIYKMRARIEGKNAEMKRSHGLTRAKWYGLVSVSKQTKLTAIAVNLKKIAKLFSSDFTLIIQLFTKNNLKNEIIIYFKNFAIIYGAFFSAPEPSLFPPFSIFQSLFSI